MGYEYTVGNLIKSTSAKLAELRATYIEKNFPFFVRLPTALKVDLAENEPLEYGYTRDYVTLGKHLDDVNDGYRYFVEYSKAAKESASASCDPVTL